MPWPVSLLCLAGALVGVAVACYWFAQTISVCRDLDRDGFDPELDDRNARLNGHKQAARR